MQPGPRAKSCLLLLLLMVSASCLTRAQVTQPFRPGSSKQQRALLRGPRTPSSTSVAVASANAPPSAGASSSTAAATISNKSKCSSSWALAAIGAAGPSSHSSSSSSSVDGGVSSGVTAANAAATSKATATTSLPFSTERVLICLISSSVHKDAPLLPHNRWSGCSSEDAFDPAGCVLPWSTPVAPDSSTAAVRTASIAVGRSLLGAAGTAAGSAAATAAAEAQGPSKSGGAAAAAAGTAAAKAAGGSRVSFRPRGTWAASLMAASAGGVIPGGTDIHVVPVDGPSTGSIDPVASAPGSKSRLRAYSVCEGRLRGLQAQDYYSGSSSGSRPAWRMVVLVDVAAAAPASNGGSSNSSGSGGQMLFPLGEAEWVKAATGPGTPEALHAPDVLMVAPAGQQEAVAYPAALPGVLGVGGLRCNGTPLQAYSPLPSSSSSSSVNKPDILAPGGSVAIPGVDKPWTDSAAAAALVAGAAARLWSAFPRCSADDVRAALLSTPQQQQQQGQQGSPQLNLVSAERVLRSRACGAQPASQ